VEVVTVDDVVKHPNADRLEIAKVKGWYCVTGYGTFNKGDLAVYIPIDSVLPPQLESVLFPPDSKIKLTNSRVKTIKIRGAVSQGLLVHPVTVLPATHTRVKVGDDVKEQLGITKYEPPVFMNAHSATRFPRPKQNPNFHKYTDIENYKNYPDVFNNEDLVYVTEKIHGTNFRCGWVEFYPYTLWGKIKKFLRLAPKYEFVYGSHNVQLQHKFAPTTFYATNVYYEAVKKYSLKEQLRPGEVLYGEIYGDGIQKGYTYGCKAGERKLVVFDIQQDKTYLSLQDAFSRVRKLELDFVPILHKGKFDINLIKEKFVKGPSVMVPSEPVREGVVIKPVTETTDPMIGRKILKLINDDYYLLPDNTDNH
jgi:RNA ligase (TIGR02306 family)